MNDDRIDQLLRRAADEVNAVVRSATPPPIDDLAGRRSRSAALVSVLLVAAAAAAGAGLVLVADRDDVMAPADPPIAEATPTAVEALEHPCESVVGISDVLANPPSSASAWVDLGVRIDELEARVAAETHSASSARRYDRFVALARQAADLGADGGFTPAESPAWGALAVAEELVEFVDVPGCQLRQSDDDPSGG